ncbi:MAG: alpha/beta fold hydrolase [Thiofilum sp.]|uniref:alpha/beta hydrolase n=1 Tax=Thiofilum sp. TaxID=2212733 RepID=UPI0025D57FE2|nr:alpha/beta fold hydrolase [Thiofilum sp.]MBK8453903.1 alpha/beta fold hydrolase [Thiofilum sp.]
MITLRAVWVSVVLYLSLGLAPLFAQEVTVKQDHLTLRADLNLASDKKIQDGVVLLLHGTLAHNRVEIIKTVAELLNDKGFNTLSINLSYSLDQRPSQMLDCAIEHQHQHEDAMQEIGTWMRWLKEQGVEQVYLMGHSRGGNQIAWYASEQDNDLIKKIVLIAPATWSAEKSASDYEERYKTPLVELVNNAQAKVAAGQGAEVLDTAGFVYCEKAKVSAKSIVSYYRADERKNTPSLLSKITKPTLVIMGSEDTTMQDLPAQMEPIKQANVQAVMIEGADHFFLDLYADELVEKTVEFFE